MIVRAHAVGVIVCKKPGEAVKAGDKVVEIHHSGGPGLAAAITALSFSFRVTPTPPTLPLLVLETLS